MSPDRRSSGATAPDSRRLRAIELTLAALVLCIVATQGRQAAWPFIAWPMYASGGPAPPDRASDVQLRLLGRDGRASAITAPALFGHVEIALGREVITRAFEDRPDQAAYRDVLLRRLRPLLSARDVVEVQGWRLAWKVHGLELPPIDLDHPTTEDMLGRIKLAATDSAAPPAAGATR